MLEADRTELSPERAGIVAESVRRRATVRTADSTGLPYFAGRTASAMAVPLLLGGEAVAVLYADSGGGPSPAERDEAAIEILCSHAARKMEAHVAFLAARHVLNERPSRHISRKAQAS
jgi:putative methionine-R-sulfoxide reductase with GAF domain